MDLTKPETKVPVTKSDSFINAEIKHEATLERFVEQSEMGILTEDQVSVISLINAGYKVGIQLNAARTFFVGPDCSMRSMSSGIGGIGRLQAKECITASAWQLPFFQDNNKPGVIDMVKSWLPGNKKAGE